MKKVEQPLLLRSYPRAIIHIDADSFFASCEQAVNPNLKGKPLITGRERGIASAVSKEAKKLGIKRGMSIKEIEEVCPGIIHVPSDYETYSLFSRRMFEIVRRHTNIIEEYSIDECFAEITGLRRSKRKSYEDIAESIRLELEMELGITFSLGLAPTKVVAKIGSKWNKPSGHCAIPGKKLHHFLKDVPAEDVWGIGPQTTKFLKNHKIETALDFARQSKNWIDTNVTKPHREIWYELNGKSVLEIQTEEHTSYKSISKTKTFTPASNNRVHVFSQLSKNIENACIKARRYNLSTDKVYVLLRTKDYRHYGLELKLSRSTSMPNEIISVVDENFERVFRKEEKYRLTGIVLTNLQDNTYTQTDLFGDSVKADNMKKVYAEIDKIDKKHGKHTVYLGTSHKTLKGKQYEGERNDAPRRSQELFKGEGPRKRLGLPMIGDVN